MSSIKKTKTIEFNHNCVFLLQVLSFSCPERINLTIQWYLRYYPCHNEFGNIEVSVRL